MVVGPVYSVDWIAYGIFMRSMEKLGKINLFEKKQKRISVCWVLYLYMCLVFLVCFFLLSSHVLLLCCIVVVDWLFVCL